MPKRSRDYEEFLQNYQEENYQEENSDTEFTANGKPSIKDRIYFPRAKNFRKEHSEKKIWDNCFKLTQVAKKVLSESVCISGVFDIQIILASEIINRTRDEAFQLMVYGNAKKNGFTLDYTSIVNNGNYIYVNPSGVLAKSICNLRKPVAITIILSGHATCALYWPDESLIEYFDPLGVFDRNKSVIQTLGRTLKHIYSLNRVTASDFSSNVQKTTDGEEDPSDNHCQTWVIWWIFVRAHDGCTPNSITKFVATLSFEAKWFIIHNFWTALHAGKSQFDFLKRIDQCFPENPSTFIRNWVASGGQN